MHRALSIAFLVAGMLHPAWAGEGTGAEGLRLSAQPVATPTFHCVGIVSPYAGDGNANSECVPRYRVRGESAWQTGHPFYADRDDREFRGSLVELRPGTVYEIELQYRDPDGVSPRATVALLTRTWPDNFPIAETIWIEPGVRARPLAASRSGSPAGYVLYSARPGREKETVFDARGQHDNNVTISGRYIIVRGLTLKNARIHAVAIRRSSHHIVIERCFITGWGRLGGHRERSDLDAGVYARGGGAQIVIQDNVITEPRGCANDWSTGHPLGPQTISLVETGGNHVIRYNNLTSTDEHRYNDVVGGGWNFGPKGAPVRDSDIYGNLISHCHDDGIEWEGLNINVRIWGNKIEHTYTGIALAPTIKGPAYVWRNVITKYGGTGFKLGEGDRKGHGGLYIYHNTIYNTDRRCGIGGWGGKGLYRQTTVRNNIIDVKGPAISDKRRDPTNSFDFDLLRGRIRVAPGNEKNRIGGNPRFVAAPAGNFMLASGSGAIDRALRLPGFNDAFRGAGPDVGALEFGAGPPHYGPRPLGGLAAAARPASRQRQGGAFWKLIAQKRRSLRATPSGDTKEVERARALAGEGKFEAAARTVAGALPEAASEREKAAVARMARGFRAALRLRGWIIDGVKRGRHEQIFVRFLGKPSRAKLVRADERRFVAVLWGSGVEVPSAWEKLSPRRLHAIAKKYVAEADDKKLLQDYALAFRLARP